MELARAGETGRSGSSPANRPAAAADAARAGAGSRATTPRACSGRCPPGSPLTGSRPWASSPVSRWNGRFAVPAARTGSENPRFPAEMAERRSPRRGQARRHPARDGNPARARAFVTIGIGINVTGAPEGLPYAATSLAQAGCAVDAPGLFRLLSGAWVEVARLWDEGRGFSRIRGAWLGLAQDSAVRWPSRPASAVSGTFETIDEAGRLVVRLAAGPASRSPPARCISERPPARPDGEAAPAPVRRRRSPPDTFEVFSAGRLTAPPPRGRFGRTRNMTAP